MNELLGFMVLSGHLFPALAWLLVTAILVLVAVRPAGDFRRRASIKLLVFVVILLLPFFDEIAGQLYLKYLCETQGGFKVFHTVELPQEYWDKHGAPNFLRNGRSLNTDVLAEYGVDYSQEEHPSVRKVSVFRARYVKKDSKEPLGELITFQYHGGWFLETFSAGATGNSCDTSKYGTERDRVLSLFIRMNR